MLVKTLSLFTLIVLCGFSQERMKSVHKVTPQELQSCKRPLVRWLNAIDNIVARTKNTHAKVLADVIHNSSCAVPSDEGGPDNLAIKYLEAPKQPSWPWVGVVFLNPTPPRRLPGKWDDYVKNSVFIAEYFAGSNAIAFREDLVQLPLLRGLIALHEMQHYWQRTHPPDRAIPNIYEFREIDAYEFEFSLLQALNLPAFSDLLYGERSRIRKALLANQGFNTDFNNPMLEKVFGRFPNQGARANAATIVMIMALFREFDALNPTEIAIRKKIAFIANVNSELKKAR